MEIVPVIDLKGGQVVHARGGERNAYRAIESSLTTDTGPLAVVEALLRLHPFISLYVADLDAIEGRSGHDAQLEALRVAFPDLHLWVDNGLYSEADCKAWLARGLGDLVIGSESQGDAGLLEALSDASGRLLLSLDFKGEIFLGPPDLQSDPKHWPPRVIAMTLARVGGQRGPDVDRLRSLVARAPGHRVFAAGGVRGLADLECVARIGAAGALVASALHDGRITGPQLRTFEASLKPNHPG
jgi:phosphoribosylformimino-5-aminoimidazole carboxamide ribotide isomerase